MNEDLISNAFVDNLDRSIVKRNVVLSKVALLLSTVYAVSHLFIWYSIFKKIDWELITGAKMIYTFFITPIIDLVIFSISIYGYFLILKAYKSINSSCNKADPSLMSKGFAYFYKANILSVILISISIIVTVLNQIL